MPGLCPVKPFGVKGCTLALNGDHVALPLGPKGWWGEITSFRAVRLACVIRFRDNIITGAATVHSTFVLSRVWAWWRALLEVRRRASPTARLRRGGVAPGFVLDTHPPNTLVPWRTPVWLTVYVGGIGVGLPPRATFRSGFWGPMEGVLGLAGFA